MRKIILFFIVVTLLLSTGVYFALKWGGEWISGVIADVIPTELQEEMGKSTIQSMEMSEFKPTSLSVYTQNKIKKHFESLMGHRHKDIKLLFRNAHYPNAFALPGNYIVLLDSLVKMSEDTVMYSDVLGVLAHEAGHLKYKHSLKLMIKSALTAAIIGYFIGDFSSFVATLSQQLLSLSYSRAYEEQADDYAIQLLHQKNLPTLPLARLLQKISQQSSEQNIPEFLSTHPITEERVKKITGKDH